jgi:hypothetical protein
MNKTLLLVIVGLCALCVGACVHSRTSGHVTRDELHAFVEDAKAHYGDNERDWPIEVRAEFVSLSARYFEGR